MKKRFLDLNLVNKDRLISKNDVIVVNKIWYKVIYVINLTVSALIIIVDSSKKGNQTRKYKPIIADDKDAL